MREDLRRGTTQRVLDWLRQGHRVTVLAGPLLGKEFLLRQVGAALAPDALTLAPLREVMRLAPTGSLVPPGSKAVPLGTVPRPHLPSDAGDDAWALTAGHPYLLAGLTTGRLAAHQRALRRRLAPLLAELEPESRALHAADSANDPHIRYRILTEEHGLRKVALDRLARLGLITRAIYGDRAGVELVPIGLPHD